MDILGWIIFGSIVGLIARLVEPRGGFGGVVGDIAVGVVGAVSGGLIYGLFGEAAVIGFNITSLMCALMGALALLAVERTIRGAHSVG